MSTDDASSSSTTRRLCRTRSESVRIFIPASTLREHAGTSTRDPSSSTTQTLHALTGVRVSNWHRVGVSICRNRHASRMVEPSATSTALPSTVTLTSSGIVEHPQLRQSGGDGVGGGLAEAANRGVTHGLRDIGQEHHVGPPVTVGRRQHALEDLLLALR